jgi:ubiquinone/menaquinone biosynthesis C-methylase UbiE
MKVIEGHVEDIPLPDEYFDKVVASASFHHFQIKTSSSSTKENFKKSIDMQIKLIL